MIRFRLGQSWKHERPPAPVDAFGLELDGVDLLSGANEEPLVKVLPDLLDALYSVVVQGRPAAELSLPDAHLELTLERRDSEALLSVVSLRRPARLLRPPVAVDLEELCDAAVRCAQAFLQEVEAVAPDALSELARRKVPTRLRALASGKRFQEPPAPPDAAGYQLFARGPWSFRFRLDDASGAVARFAAKRSGALASLLAPGEVALEASAHAAVWRASGPPFLTVLELSRQSQDILRAAEADETSLMVSLAGHAPELELRFRDRELRTPTGVLAVDPLDFARALFELGLELGIAFRHLNAAQGRNPYLSELTDRCRDGLAQLRRIGAPAVSAVEQAFNGRRKRAKAQPPLNPAGTLRRLRFDLKWRQTGLGDTGRLLMGADGRVLVSSADQVHAFTSAGAPLYRHQSSHGVASSADGRVITATADTVLLFKGEEPEARWLRDHDGLPLGPELVRERGVLVTPSSGRGVVAFCEATGRELWRVDPPRSQRSYMRVLGGRVLLGTDAGYLYGLDLRDGQVKFRMRAALPFAAPVAEWGTAFVGLLATGTQSVWFAAEGLSGQPRWTFERSWSSPARPVPLGANRVCIAGVKDGAPALLALSKAGKVQWERPLPLTAGSLSLIAAGAACVATDTLGAAALFDGRGNPGWRLGAAGAALAQWVEPRWARRVLIVPGEQVRAVEARTGRVLAEVEAGPGLRDLAVDAKLNLYLLDDAGELRAYGLSSHLALL